MTSIKCCSCWRYLKAAYVLFITDGPTKAGQSNIKINFCFVLASKERQKQSGSPLIFVMFHSHENYFIRFQFAVDPIERFWMIFFSLCFFLWNWSVFFILSAELRDAVPINKLVLFHSSPALKRHSMSVLWLYVLFSLSQPNDCIIQFIRKHFKCFATSIPSHLIGYEMFHVLKANGIESKRIESNQWSIRSSGIITIGDIVGWHTTKRAFTFIRQLYDVSVIALDLTFSFSVWSF